MYCNAYLTALYYAICQQLHAIRARGSCVPDHWRCAFSPFVRRDTGAASAAVPCRVMMSE